MNRAARYSLWLALAYFVLAASRGSAQQPNAAFLQGTQAFRCILHFRHFKPVTDPEELTRDPEHSILVALGMAGPVDSIPGGVRKFVEQGGALLVATDRSLSRTPTDPRSSVTAFGVEVVEQPVLAKREQDCYQQIPQCPLVLPMRTGDAGLFGHLKNRVATNCTGFLRLQPGSRLRVQARLPGSCESEKARTSWERAGYFPFAAAGSWGKGRVLFLADHSVFINNMMLQVDTGNIGFAYNCLDWLRSGGKEPRDRVLLYDEGKIVTDFDVPVAILPPSLPDVEDPFALMDNAIAGLEDENMHNRLLLEYVGHSRLLKWMALGLTSLLVAYGILRIFRSRYRLDAAAPLLAPTLARLAPAGAGIGPRNAALLAGGNLWEPARALAREFFETALATSDPPPGATLPPFQSSESWLTRRFLERLIVHLWRLAYGSTPERVTPAAFAHLAAQVDELKAALADGSLRFLTTSMPEGANRVMASGRYQPAG